ncbi:MAG: PBP1A family penicillin-binding protein [Deltaproteobacteria bacterium]|jgi:penicillin-binding protein 1A|nr:PBP1A family penicillin-binding protein [Deltaproteobacteria bacterium]
MKRKILFRGLIALVILGILGAITLTGVIFWVSRDLPSYTRVSDYRPPQVTTVYARDGSIIGYFYDEKRFLVALSQMPDHLWQAFVAAEDASFFEHDGISFKAILRAFIKNTLSGNSNEGGSTITQQVVKRILLTPEKSYTRKLKEAILSYRLESYLSKEDILNIYLNQIYLGSGAYGVESAARTYFAKHVEDLTLAEAAVLAGLPQSPSKVNPYADPETTKSRQRYVLRRMLEEGMIDQTAHDAAMAAPLLYASLPEPPKTGAWYKEEVERELTRFLSEQNVRDLNLPLERFGREALYNAGLHIYTSMDRPHQEAAEIALRKGILETSKRQGWHGPESRIPPEEIPAWLEKNPFEPQFLDDAGWVKAVVVKVDAKEAQVRLGAYQGGISAKLMEWCRVPDPKRSNGAPGQVRTPDKVLAVGDIVWVSAVGGQGTLNPLGAPAGAQHKAYASDQATPETSLALCLEQIPEVDGALVSEETETGDIVALVGGYTPPPGNHFNRATRAKRQPGSSFKPVVYSAALDQGFTAASMINDAPVVSEMSTGAPRTPGSGPELWRPSNFDGIFYGPILLRTALVKSRNLCTIRLAQSIGVSAIIERAHALGIEGDIPPDLSISLGSYAVTPMTMTEVYTAFANGGTRVRPRTVIRIEDSWGRTVVNFRPEKVPAITPQTAYIMSRLLKDAVQNGTGFRAKVLKRAVGGKTGTTNEEHDAWFIGFTPYLVSTVYVGFDNNKPLGVLETGSRVAVPIFVDYRRQVEELYPEDDFRTPPGVRLLNVDETNGFLAGEFSEKIVSLPFVEGSEPRVVSGAPLKRGEDDLGSAEDLFKQ